MGCWWIDETPYPGPDQIEPGEALAEFGKALHSALADVAKAYFSFARRLGKSQVIRDFVAEQRRREEAEARAKNTWQPYRAAPNLNHLHIHLSEQKLKQNSSRHGPHSPYLFDRRGRRRY